MEAMDKLTQHLRGRIDVFVKAKQEGRKLIGYSPGGFLPEDLITAVGAVPMPLLRGGSHEAVAESAVYLPRFIDTFCRSQIGYRMLGEDPLYQMIDYLVVPVTDNNSRAIAESFAYYTPVETFRFGIPHDKEEDAVAYYLEGLNLLKNKLEHWTGNKLDEDKLKASLSLSNKMWDLLAKISDLRKSKTPPISGEDFIKLNHATFYGDKAFVVQCLEDMYKELKGVQGPKPNARILLTGSTIAYGDYKVPDLVQRAGGAVVVEEFAEGMRHYWERVKLDGGDIMEALADRYFARRVTPAWFRPSHGRIDFIEKLARDYAVDGIIHYQLLYRDGYDIQYYYFEKIIDRDLGLKSMKLESDYDTSEIVPMSTRVEAFVQTVKRR